MEKPARGAPGGDFRGKCHACHREGHIAKNCPEPPSRLDKREKKRGGKEETRAAKAEHKVELDLRREQDKKEGELLSLEEANKDREEALVLAAQLEKVNEQLTEEVARIKKEQEARVVVMLTALSVDNIAGYWRSIIVKYLVKQVEDGLAFMRLFRDGAVGRMTHPWWAPASVVCMGLGLFWVICHITLLKQFKYRKFEFDSIVEYDVVDDRRTDASAAAMDKPKHKAFLAKIRCTTWELFRLPAVETKMICVETLMQIMSGRNVSVLQEPTHALLRFTESAALLASVNLPRELVLQHDIVNSTATFAFLMWLRRVEGCRQSFGIEDFRRAPAARC